jgi:hypothetical protein
MRYGTIDVEYADFLSTVEPQSDGPILMVNLMKYRPVAEYEVEITEAATETGDTHSSGVVVEIEIVHDRLDEVITGREWTRGATEASVA